MRDETGARAVINGALSEAEFQAQVVALAKACGWMVYHTHDSRRSAEGFPDLVLASATQGLVLFAELKTERGALTAAQIDWQTELQLAGARAFVWRPRDWHVIEGLLTHGRDER